MTQLPSHYHTSLDNVEKAAVSDGVSLDTVSKSDCAELLRNVDFELRPAITYDTSGIIILRCHNAHGSQADIGFVGDHKVHGVFSVPDETGTDNKTVGTIKIETLPRTLTSIGLATTKP